MLDTRLLIAMPFCGYVSADFDSVRRSPSLYLARHSPMGSEAKTRSRSRSRQRHSRFLPHYSLRLSVADETNAPVSRLSPLHMKTYLSLTAAVLALALVSGCMRSLESSMSFGRFDCSIWPPYGMSCHTRAAPSIPTIRTIWSECSSCDTSKLS